MNGNKHLITAHTESPIHINIVTKLQSSGSFQFQSFVIKTQQAKKTHNKHTQSSINYAFLHLKKTLKCNAIMLLKKKSKTTILGNNSPYFITPFYLLYACW